MVSMMPSSVRFLEPLFLWALLIPAVLVLIWSWQFWRRRVDVRRLLRNRTLPERERYPLAGELAFWLCLILALACLAGALARPQLRVNVVQRAGLDFVILQDGSTSMRVTDVAPSRWARSTTWLRTFAETLSWTNERVALALFAYRPAPQVRLTRDPNAFFFFLDRLQEQPPFRLEDDTSWDTNIADGVRWGVKMVDLDEELYGRRPSTRAFLILSDGQDWSGEVEDALALARDRGVRVYVIGVGTDIGGLIPDLPPGPFQPQPPPIVSSLDRQSLRTIAEAGGGEYYELGTEQDDVIALRVLSDVQSQAQTFHRQEIFAELYWPLLAAAAGAVCLGTLTVRERIRLWLLLAGAAAAVIFVLVL